MNIVIGFSNSDESCIHSVQIAPNGMTIETIHKAMEGTSDYKVLELDDSLRPVFEYLEARKYAERENLIKASGDIIDKLGDIESEIEYFHSYIRKLENDIKERELKDQPSK